MKEIYEDAPKEIAEAIEASVPVDDFLPSPDELLGKVKKRRVTITLSERSVERFKRYANAQNTKYQTLISEVVDSYSHKLVR
ncbi:MAG: CopG family transcriptional regulator [Candidatus Nomurabacteria bacterium]|jgi:predicted DNA binding CopG/RHH family protein|nr:CopG family transcriptional regulator [Candidatus Nomurabacteria bacterium]